MNNFILSILSILLLTGTANAQTISSLTTSYTDTTATYQFRYTGTPQRYQIFLDTDLKPETGYKLNASLGANYLIENKSLYKFSGSSTTTWGWTLVRSGLNVSNSNGTYKVTISRADIGNPNSLWLIARLTSTIHTARVTQTFAFGTVSNVTAVDTSTHATYQFNYTGSPTYHQVFLDADLNASTGFAINGIGADYLVENGRFLKHSGANGAWGWTTVRNVDSTNSNGLFKVTLTRSELGNPNSVNVVGAIARSLTDRIASSAVRHNLSSPAPTPIPTPASLPVIPDEAGFGITTPAGRGGRVIKVKNLNASGADSLKACIEASGPRVCVFEVSGSIKLTSDLNIRNSYITIAGQTAPSPGINIVGAGLGIYASDVLVQHIRIRVGDDPNGPAISNRDAIKIGALDGKTTQNVVIDHVSCSWSMDEMLSTWADNGNVRNVTILNSYFAEALGTPPTHLEGKDSRGVLFGRNSAQITFANNLLAFNGYRNPLIRDNVTDVMVVNNFIYRPGRWTGYKIDIGSRGNRNIPLRASIVGNDYVPHPSYADKYNETIRVHDDAATNVKIFVFDNLGPRASSNKWSVVTTNRSISSIDAGSSPQVWVPNMTTMNARDVEPYVLRYAGARPADRDPTDRRIVNLISTRSSGGVIVTTPPDMNAAANLPRNTRALTPPSDPNGVASNGYTNLENWLHNYSRIVEGR